MYKGPERRQHRVLVTANTEYHMRGDVCVAVRDLGTNAWLGAHEALGARLVGGITPLPNGSYKVRFGEAGPGDQLCFSHDVVTSPLNRVARPPREIVQGYIL